MTSENEAGKRYHHGDLRAALVAEARHMVEENGPDELSLRALANAAGVSRAAPYHHFADKAALLAAVAADGFRELARHMNERATDSTDPRARLDAIGLGYVEFGVRHPELFRLMQGPAFQLSGRYPDLDAARGESAAPLLDTVLACLPGARRDQIMEAAAAAWSIVHGMATLSTDGRMKTLIDIDDLAAAVGTVTNKLDLNAA